MLLLSVEEVNGQNRSAEKGRCRKMKQVRQASLDLLVITVLYSYCRFSLTYRIGPFFFWLCSLSIPGGRPTYVGTVPLSWSFLLSGDKAAWRAASSVCLRRRQQPHWLEYAKKKRSHYEGCKEIFTSYNISARLNGTLSLISIVR